MIQTKRFSVRQMPLMVVVWMTLTTVWLANTPAGLAEYKKSDRDQTWVATWGSGPVPPLPPNPSQADPNPGFTNQTVRMIIRTSIGGTQVRVRFSNAFGADSLVIGAAHIALHGKGAAIVEGTDRALAFSGAASTTIPPGALVVSDPVQLDVPDLSDLAVTIFLPGPTGPATWHPAAQVTNFVSPAGDFSGSADMPVDHTMTSWFYLTDVEVAAPKRTLAIIAIGDSITDGAKSTLDTNHRWPNFLAQRLLAHHIKMAVIDEGIGSNRLLHDPTGQNVLARLDRDVLSQSGAGYLTVLIGINDILYSVRNHSQEVSADEIKAGLLQIITRAHERGLKVFGCTLTPAEGSRFATEDSEAKRAAVNKFIRSSGAFDAVIDFDEAVRDPAHPGKFLPANDSGDHLHPNDAGYQAMAGAINLSLFRQGR